MQLVQDAEYMAVNAKTNRLYVPQWDRSRDFNPAGTDNQGLTIINTQTNQVLTTIEMPVAPGSTAKSYQIGVAVDEANNVVYISANTAEAEAAEAACATSVPGYILAFDCKDNSC